MSTLPTIAELLERNVSAAKHHQPLPLLSELSQLPPEEQVPMPKIFLVSCCDNRIDPHKIFGLQQWDAVVVRSCAGRMGPQLENLIFLDHVLQFTDVIILHHTDCSAEIFQNDDVRRILTQRAPGQVDEVKRMRLPGFEDLDQSVRDDLSLVRTSPLIRKDLADRTIGFVFDINSGKVKAIKS